MTAACAASSPSDDLGGGTLRGGSRQRAIAGAGGTGTSDGTAAGAGVGGLGAVSLVSAGGAGTGSKEICDGIDNDGNGIIDDVDVGHDGVCDCLNIGTIGELGPWGNGTGVFGAWLNTRSPRGAVALGDQTLTPALLAPFEVIVVLHVALDPATSGGNTAAGHHPFSDDEASAFKQWVEAGGGVMTTIGYLDLAQGPSGREETNVNQLLSGLGIKYTTGYVSGYITDWNATHPIADGISNIQTINGLLPDATSGTKVGLDSWGDGVLQAFELGSGRAVMWGDEWITYDSQWKDITSQQVERLWLNILKWLSPPKKCQVPIPPTVH